MSLKWDMSHAKNVIHNFPKAKKTHGVFMLYV